MHGGSNRAVLRDLSRFALYLIIRGSGNDPLLVGNTGFFVNSFDCAEGPKIGKIRMNLDQENIVGQVTPLGVT